MPQAPVVSRVIMNPLDAKQLMYALTDNVRKYEEKFGEIPTPGKPGGQKQNPFSNN